MLSCVLALTLLHASALVAFAAPPTANSFSASVSTVGASSIRLRGADMEGTPLSFAVVSPPSHGTLSGLNAANGAITYNPATGYVGTDSFTYNVTSAGETSATATVSLNVTNAGTVDVQGGFTDATKDKMACLGSGVSVAQKATGGAGTSASPYTGWDTAVSWASNTTYCFDAGATFALSKPLIILNTKNTRLVGAGAGGVIIRFTGAGIPLTFKSTSTSTYTGNAIENIELVGNASATGGIYMESQHHSTVRNVRTREHTGKALHWRWGVCNLIENFRVSQVEDLFTVRPANGIYVEKRGAGETFQANTIINAIIEGTGGDGIVLHDAWQNTIIGGTSEGNLGGGLNIAATSRANTIIGTDFEANNGTDVVIAGSYNVLQNALSTGTVIISGGKGNQIVGGQLNQITIGAGASNTVLQSAGFNLSGTGDITDNSPSTVQLTQSLNVATGGTRFLATAPTLQGAWVNHAGSFETAAYYRVGPLVFLRGAVKSGSNGSVIFALPTGYRPTGMRQYVVHAGAGLGLITVQSGGNVVFDNFTGDTSIVNLDGISFDAP